MLLKGDLMTRRSAVQIPGPPGIPNCIERSARNLLQHWTGSVCINNNNTSLCGSKGVWWRKAQMPHPNGAVCCSSVKRKNIQTRKKLEALELMLIFNQGSSVFNVVPDKGVKRSNSASTTI